MAGLSPQAIDDKYEMGIGARKWETYGEGGFIDHDLKSPTFPSGERDDIEIPMK